MPTQTRAHSAPAAEADKSWRGSRKKQKPWREAPLPSHRRAGRGLVNALWQSVWFRVGGGRADICWGCARGMGSARVVTRPAASRRRRTPNHPGSAAAKAQRLRPPGAAKNVTLPWRRNSQILRAGVRPADRMVSKPSSRPTLTLQSPRPIPGDHIGSFGRFLPGFQCF